MSKTGVKVCVVTSYAAAHEPRAPRHAAALAQLGEVREVVFIDCAPDGAEAPPLKTLTSSPKIRWHTHRFATRATNPLKLAIQRAWQQVQRLKFKCHGPLSPTAFSTKVWGLERVLMREKADVYLAHTLDTLLAAYRVALRHKALVMFDSMEFHSDMGEEQTPLDRAMAQRLEKSCLPGCALVLASSDQVADALVEEYGIPRPLPLQNVPPIEHELPAKDPGFHLYWRNSVVGLGHRGLDDALMALARLPAEITLHLQGRLPADGGAALRTRISELKLTDRVIFHPPYTPESAVREAARHHVGLCLERKSCRNHDLTISSKIFDYHMAGLPVIASDLPGLSAVLKRSGGGVTFRPDDVEDLTTKLLALHTNPYQLATFNGMARMFALKEGNWVQVMDRFKDAFRVAVAQRKISPA